MALRAVVMGVSGCGKTTVAAAAAEALGVAFVDADDLHPEANVARMRAGIALGDAERWPWLDRVARALAMRAPVILACSALRRSHRDRLRAGAGGPLRFVHLTGDPALIAARLAGRRGHYMPPALLDSQIATLEPPGADENALTLDVAAPPAALVAAVLADLGGRG